MIYQQSVIRALRSAGVDFRASGRTVHIFCPFHPDYQSPSLVIYTDSDPVSWHCFGCQGHGLWSKLAEALKAGDLNRDWNDPLACRHLNLQIENLFTKDPALPPLTRPWIYGSWREFSGDTLTMVHSRWWWDDIDRVRRILWPIWNIRGNLVGWVGRDLDGHAEEKGKKYRNMPKMKATSALWPFPIRRKSKETCLVLVEGITDALRLLQYGIPALAILGTTWSRARTALIQVLGVNRVVLAFDPGNAGDEATQRVGNNLKRALSGLTLDVWTWSDDHDPGDAPEEEILDLKEGLFGNRNLEKHRWLYTAGPKAIPLSWFASN